MASEVQYMRWLNITTWVRVGTLPLAAILGWIYGVNDAVVMKTLTIVSIPEAAVITSYGYIQQFSGPD